MRRLLIIGLILISACSESIKVDIEQEKQEIIKHTESWSNFTSPEEYLNHVTDDFIYLPNGGDPITNRDSIYKMISNLCEFSDFSFPVWTSEEIIICNNLAIHRYSGEVYLHSRKDSSILLHDYWKYIDILRKTNEGWRVSRHMFNKN
jgi:ketosteroid isomerase-like protein